MMYLAVRFYVGISYMIEHVFFFKEQISTVFMAACIFYQHKDDHFLIKRQTCLTLLSHIINDSLWTLSFSL